MKKTILALSLIMGISSAASVSAALPQSIRIGTDTTYAPFSSKDSKGNFIGFDIDLGNELCSRIKVKCTWVGSDFDALIPSLKAKKIDAIISSLSITEKRQQEIAFSDKLYAADSRLIAAKGSPIQPTLESLKGKHVGVLQGSPRRPMPMNAGAARAWMLSPMLTRISSIPTSPQGALTRRCRMKSRPVKVSSNNLPVKTTPFAGPSVKDKKYFGDGTGIGLRKEDGELKAAFRQSAG